MVEAASRPRREKIAIGFLIVWIVFWTACMFIVLYGLVMALVRGDMAPAGFMLLWLAAATFGLSQGIRILRKLLFEGAPGPKAGRDHEWKDGVGGDRQNR